MSKKDRPLPKPKKTPFGRNRSFGEEEAQEPLLADKMAMAMAEGRLDDFLREQIPDNEHARKLTEMMMGMTGMMPGGTAPGKGPESGKEESVTAGEAGEHESRKPAEPPPEIVQAAMAGDMAGLMGLLKREHEKRKSGGGKAGAEKTEAEKKAPEQEPASHEKELLKRLIRISSENGVTMDWLIMRALKLYVSEYEKTGRL